MPDPRECPEKEGWQALFGGTLPLEQRRACEQHLESCPTCQNLLHRAVEDADELVGLARQLGDPTRTPRDLGLEAVIARLYHSTNRDRAEAVAPIDLYFLGPPARAGELGTLGNYEVREVIGQGGMGLVLKAFEPALGRLVAVKVLSPALAGSTTAPAALCPRSAGGRDGLPRTRRRRPRRP